MLFLRPIHQERCPLTSVAIKGVHIGISPLHGAPSHRGSHFRGGVPCAVMGCLPPTGWYTMDGTMLVEDGKEDVSSWGSCLDTYLTLSTCRQQMEVLLRKCDPLWEGAPCKGLMPMCIPLCLDGYTCQGTPSLIDGPQIKPSHQLEPLHVEGQPSPLSTPRQLDSLDTRGARGRPAGGPRTAVTRTGRGAIS